MYLYITNFLYLQVDHKINRNNNIIIFILLSLLDEFEVQCYFNSILSIACLAVWSDYVKICYENEESNFI